MEAIRNREVLQSVLLQTLTRFPHGVTNQKAYEEIEESFSFPEEWYREIPASTGHEELKRQGFPDWRDISQEKLVQLVPTEPQWQNEIRWARNDLKKNGYLDTSAPRGVWRLTETGVRTARKPLSQTLNPAEQKIATPRPRKEKVPTVQADPMIEPGLTTRENMKKKLDILISGMPVKDMELLVDIARSIRLRSLDE